MKPFTEYQSGLQSLVIFRGLLEKPLIARLGELFSVKPKDVSEFVSRYCAFVSALYAEGDNLSEVLLTAVLEDENLYVRRLASGKQLSPQLDACLAAELSLLQRISALGPAELTSVCSYEGFLPEYAVSEIDFTAAYTDRLEHLQERGYGMFAQYHVFTVDEGSLVPVKHPDPQQLSQLTGYELERSRLIANTEALLAGKPANNALLYGDAGTGKSSTVKAIANAYRDQGLRLIEVKKNQLYQIPDLVDALSANPCRFILFIDDLSFNANDNDFSALKAILEGSVSGHSKNLVVYATSNRRHLIKENVSDRDGNDLHFFDTMQELMSLSARFGLTITFSRPEKKLYLDIVRDLALQYGVDLPEELLFARAETHALRNGGRSPRTAKQFIEMTKAGVLE